MHEIERRFLVTTTPVSLPDPIEIEQAYISTGAAAVRVRRANQRHILTIKTGSGMVRTEIERDLTEAEYRALWEAGEQLRIAKRRYLIDLGGGITADYDEFDGELAGRRLVEVEFPDLDTAQAFTPPDWFGDEITDDGRYTNLALATVGWPD